VGRRDRDADRQREQGQQGTLARTTGRDGATSHQELERTKQVDLHVRAQARCITHLPTVSHAMRLRTVNAPGLRL
jgi:hypothetical protein